MKIARVFLSTSLALGALVFAACDPDSDPDPNDGSNFDTQSSVDNAKMDAEFESIGSIVQEVAEDYTDTLSGNKQESGCAVLTFDTTNKRITVDFGTGCTDFDGRTRTGKLHIDYTGAYRDNGSIITTSTDNYTIDGIRVEGQRKVTNKGGSFATGGITYDVVVSAVGSQNDYAIWTDGTDTISWKSSRTRKWITDGGTTIDPCDDEYEIYGLADGINRSGRVFTMTVLEQEALDIDLSCYCNGVRMPKAGILTLSPSGLANRVIDYSKGGACDYAVNVSIGALSFDLTLN